MSSSKTTRHISRKGTMKLAAIFIVAFGLLAVGLTFAANGDGRVVSYSPDAVTTGKNVTVEVEFLNNGSTCLDELVITPPSTWSGPGPAFVSNWSRGPIVFTNEADSGDGNPDNGDVADPESVRIRPSPGNSKILCAGEKVTFKIGNLTAPSSPEISTFQTWTSDMNSVFRQQIQPPFIVIRVTDAEGLKIEYVQLRTFSPGGGNGSEIKFLGTGKGGWGRVTELYVTKTPAGATTADVYMDANNDGFLQDATDFLLANNAAIAGGGTRDTVPLVYTTSMDVGAIVQDGFIKDGSSITFFVDIAGGGTFVTPFDGHADVALVPDPTVIGTGFEGVAEGTVINVDAPFTRRTIKIQLVRIDGSGRLIDVRDSDVPIYFTTDLSTFNKTSPHGTDGAGEVEIPLNPGTVSGIAEVEILQLGLSDGSPPFTTQTEFVGINSGAAASWQITRGNTSTNVVAGNLQLIEVTVYDQFGNVITDIPAVRNFDFTLLSAPTLWPALGGAALDDDDVPGSPSLFEPEPTSQGISDVNLLTSTTIGNHTVQVHSTDGLSPTFRTVVIHGILGAPAKIVIGAPTQMNASQCIVATVKITDANGNLINIYNDTITGHPQQWTSLVRVQLSNATTTDHPSPVTGNSSTTHITDSNFKEKEISSDGQYVQGKLTNGQGTVTICGCQGLGTFDIEAFSDTLESDQVFVNVANAPPSCISVDIIEDSLLSCEPDAQIDVGVLDVCGNYVVNQQCGGGANAQTCVGLTLGGVQGPYLSTDVVCVDLTKTGHAPRVDLIRNTTACGLLTINTTPQQQCCVNGFPTNLPICDPETLTLIGKPVNITSEFFADRNGVPIQNNGSERVSEKVKDLFKAVDACGNVVPDFIGEIDVDVKGEDCVSFIEVDSPANLSDKGVYCTGTPTCSDLTPQGQGKCQESACSWSECSTIQNMQQCAQTPGCQPAPDDSACLGSGFCAGTATKNICDHYTYEQCWFYNVEDRGEGCPFIRETCQLPETPVFKLVVDNCAQPGKQWTDLEEEDIMVDKLAFMVSAPDYSGLEIEIWRESEKTPGFQSSEDILVGTAPVDNVASAPNGLTVAELDDVADYFGPDWFTRGTEADGGAGDEREGGVLIRAGDTSDFYVILKHNNGALECGVYDVNFAFYQDYNSPDITGREFSGNVEDYNIDNDDHDYLTNSNDGTPDDDSRNDEYAGTGSQDYGFGDRFLNNLDFKYGQAWIKIRDLTAEHVTVTSSDVLLKGKTCDYEPEPEFGKCFLKNNCKSPVDPHVTKEDCQDVRGESWRDSNLVCHDLPQADASLIDVVPNPEEINFISQLATQVVLINHDGFEPKVAECNLNEIRNDVDLLNERTFLLNLQTADGFQNDHAKQLEVRLEWCLQWPLPVSPDENGELNLNKIPDFAKKFPFDDQDVDKCFNKKDLRDLISSKFEGYLNPVLFGQFFGPEFQDFINSIFADDVVVFLDVNGNPLPVRTDNEGNEYALIFTNASGQKQFRVASPSTGLFKIIANPLALDQDFTFVNFKAGKPTKLDALALPGFGVPADGEEEAFVLLRALDKCGNVVNEQINDTTVTIRSPSGQATISRDFACDNNYDQDVTFDFTSNLFGIYGSFSGIHADSCLLQVMDDIPENATITATNPLLASNTTQVAFQGAPVKLKIVSIMPSDRLPADGVCPREFPADPESPCVEGRLATGAWVDVEIQDKNSNRVTGYLGRGFEDDPGDRFGLTDFRFDNICIKFDDPNAYIPKKWWEAFPVPDGFGNSTTFGWISFNFDGTIPCEGKPGESCNVYCGDLLFGKGSVYVAYENTDNNHGGSFHVTAFDKPQFQCQEINENGLPNSNLTTQCQKDVGQIDFVDPATKWNAELDRIVIPADGTSEATITVKVENNFMAIRQAVEGTAQADLDGTVLSWASAGGVLSDPLNPASIVFLTDPKTGLTTLRIKSDTPGRARITITGGDAYVCRTDGTPGLSGRLHGLHPDLLDPLLDLKYSSCAYSSVKDLQPKVIEVEFLKVESNQLSLVKGWNFVSTPHRLNASGDTLGEIMTGSACFSGTAFNWSAGTQSFSALTLGTQLKQLEGYWILMNCSEIRNLQYFAASGATTPPNKAVVAGWNTFGLTLDNPLLVELGLISVDHAYTHVVDWLEGAQDYGLPVANIGGQCDSSIPPLTLPFTTCGAKTQPKQAYWFWSIQSAVLSGFDV